MTLVFLLSLISLNGFSQNNWNETKHTIDIIESIKDNAIPVEHAEKFGALPVQFRGRVMPLNTFSSEILRKIHNETNIYNLNSDQFLLSLLVTLKKWSHAKLFPGDHQYLSYNQFF